MNNVRLFTSSFSSNYVSSLFSVLKVNDVSIILLQKVTDTELFMRFFFYKSFTKEDIEIKTGILLSNKRGKNLFFDSVALYFSERTPE